MRTLFLVLGLTIGYGTGYLVRAQYDRERKAELHSLISRLGDENAHMARALTRLNTVVESSHKTLTDVYAICGGIASILPVPPPSGRGRK